MARNLKNLVRLIDKVNSKLPPEQSFLQDLKRSIELTDRKNKKEGSRSYKPSSMKCIRQMYYIVTGAKADDTGNSYCGIGILNSGTDIHQRIQQAVLDMKDNGMDCEYVNVADFVRSRNLNYLTIVKEPDFAKGEYETKLFHNDLRMSFLCDGIIRYYNQYYILELKTENSNKFWSRQGVDNSHLNQATAYSIAFGLNDVIFIYISRDTLDMKSFMLTPTDDMKNNLIGMITTCDDYVSKLKVPPKPLTVDKHTCEYCTYKTQCRKD